MQIYSLPDTRQVVLRTHNAQGYTDQATIDLAATLTDQPFDTIRTTLRAANVRGWVAEQLAFALCGERAERWFAPS